MLNIFRIASLLEGCSYLLILSVTVGLVSRDFVFALGITHGALFVLYVILSLLASHKQSWSLITWLMVFLASLVPFAFIAVELFIQKQLKKSSSSAT